MSTVTPTAKTKTCDNCFAVLPPATRTCTCGFAFDMDPLTNAVPDEVEAELVELTQSTLDEKRAEWDRLCASALERGYKSGWAFHRYKERFGNAPPKSFTFPKDPRLARAYSDEEKRAYFTVLEEVARANGYRRGYAFVRYRAKFNEAPPIDFDAPRS